MGNVSWLGRIYDKIVELISGALNPNGGFDVNIQDQTTAPVVFYFSQVEGVPTKVAAATTLPTYDITVVSTTGCSVGGYFGCFNADDPLNNRAYFGEILAINGSVLTMDTPLDFEFQIGDIAACLERDMNVDGSGTPEIFQVEVGGNATQSIDITRIMITMLLGSAPGLSEFGDLTALTKGLVLRRVNGKTNNIWNAKKNSDLANFAYDLTLQSAVNPVQGQNGLLCRYTFAGQDKHGVAVRLEPGDKLQLIIQDDLTDLDEFRVIAEGHYVD